MSEEHEISKNMKQAEKNALLASRLHVSLSEQGDRPQRVNIETHFCCLYDVMRCEGVLFFHRDTASEVRVMGSRATTHSARQSKWTQYEADNSWLTVRWHQ